jgi:quercetin dioxygenase-like cupin family protein
MKLYRFDIEAGEAIDRFGSSGFVISKIARWMDGAAVNCAYLAPQGVIGFHQTTTEQLFLVVQGEGWVRGAEPERTALTTGQAAYWEREEWHESGTETGMIAILIEGAKFDLARLTPLE